MTGGGRCLLVRWFLASTTHSPFSYPSSCPGPRRLSVLLLPTRPTSKPPFTTLKPSSWSPFRPATAYTVPFPKMYDESAFMKRIKLKLNEVGIQYNSDQIGEHIRMVCPKCNGGSQTEKCLGVIIYQNGEKASWKCFRGKCGWEGAVWASENVSNQKAGSAQSLTTEECRAISIEGLQLQSLCDKLIEYFSVRMISPETLRRNGVMQSIYNGEDVIAFTYRREGKLVSCKYRDLTKQFWKEKDTETIFYGLDDIKNESEIIIVEGEMDKLSMEEAGYRNCVSVPDGAPPKVSEKLPDEDKDKKYQYLWKCKGYFEKASRIILATDADPPGQALAEELARRIGKERCWRVRWPKITANKTLKDANEVLMYLGPHALRKAIDDAEAYPIAGLFTFSDFFDEIDDYYHCAYYKLGASTGWKAVDELYKVVPGELTVISGVPNSGKSEWIDALMCNLNEKENWTFALCSMENKVCEHARKLLEKYVKKPFFKTWYGESSERMTVEELKQGKQWLNDTFMLIRCQNDSLPSIDWVLTIAKGAVLRYGVRGLVIDPYNELDHQRPSNQTETEYVSRMLTKIRRFAQHHGCHVWLVAHPRQLHNWGGEPPSLYDISGSAHFVNKCDNGIVIHRNRDPDSGPIDRVEVYVRKVRNKVIGKIGHAFLSYNRVTGEFMDLEG